MNGAILGYYQQMPVAFTPTFYQKFPALTIGISTYKLNNVPFALEAFKVSTLIKEDIKFFNDRFISKDQIIALNALPNGNGTITASRVFNQANIATEYTAASIFAYQTSEVVVDEKNNPTFKFVGSNMIIPALPEIRGAFSFFFVGDIRVLTQSYLIWSEDYRDGIGNGFSIFDNNGNIQFIEWNGTGYVNQTTYSTAREFSVTEFSRDADGKYRMRVNGTTVSTSSTTSTLTFPIQSLRIGNSAGGGGQTALTADLGAILLFNSDIANERTAMTNDLIRYFDV